LSLQPLIFIIYDRLPRSLFVLIHVLVSSIGLTSVHYHFSALKQPVNS